MVNPHTALIFIMAACALCAAVIAYRLPELLGAL